MTTASTSTLAMRSSAVITMAPVLSASALADASKASATAMTLAPSIWPIERACTWPILPQPRSPMFNMSCFLEGLQNGAGCGHQWIVGFFQDLNAVEAVGVAVHRRAERCTEGNSQLGSDVEFAHR